MCLASLQGPPVCSYSLFDRRARESDPGQQAVVSEMMQPDIERILVNKADGIVKLEEALNRQSQLDWLAKYYDGGARDVQGGGIRYGAVLRPDPAPLTRLARRTGNSTTPTRIRESPCHV